MVSLSAPDRCVEPEPLRGGQMTSNRTGVDLTILAPVLGSTGISLFSPEIIRAGQTRSR